MLTVAGFPISRHPDGAFARYRAFMLAYSAADAPGGIDKRSLKPDKDVNQTALRRWRIKWKIAGHFQPPFPVADNAT